MSLPEILIELTIIAAAIWPLVRLCATPPFLRKLRSFPVMALGLTAVLPGLGFFLAVAVSRYPILLRITAISAGAWLLLTGLRARPGFGRSHQLPPGSLGVLPIGPLVDDRFFLRQASRHGPVFKTSQFWRPMVCIVGLERCQELLRRYDECLAPPALPFDGFVPGGFIRSMPAEVHDHYAPMMRVAFHGDELSREDESIAIAVKSA